MSLTVSSPPVPIEKGLAEDSLYLDFDGSAYQIPADVMEKYNAAVAAIKDGTIVVPSTIEEAKVWKGGVNRRVHNTGLKACLAFGPELYLQR